MTEQKAAAIKKVPGEVKPVGRLNHEAERFRRELAKPKSVAELKDLLERQKGILSNAALLKTLADGGSKVRRRKEQLEELLEGRKPDAAAAAADLLSQLTIDTDAMEWKFGGARLTQKQLGSLDSDDDSEEEENPDPLKLLASRSEVPQLKNSYRRAIDERSFVPCSCATAEISEEKKAEIPLHRRKHDAEEGGKAGRSEAMPEENLLPPLKHQPVVVLDLKESLALQQEQGNKVKQLWLRQAADKLKERFAPPTQEIKFEIADGQKMAYRSTDRYDEENIDDDDDEGSADGVSFTVTEYETE